MFTLLFVLFFNACTNHPAPFDLPEDMVPGGFEALEDTDYALYLGCLPGLGDTCRGVWQWSEGEYIFFIQGECAGRDITSYGYYFDELKIYPDGESFGRIICEEQTGDPEFALTGWFRQEPEPIDAPEWQLTGEGVYTTLELEIAAPREESSSFYGYRYNPNYTHEPEISCP